MAQISSVDLRRTHQINAMFCSHSAIRFQRISSSKSLQNFVLSLFLNAVADPDLERGGGGGKGGRGEGGRS